MRTLTESVLARIAQANPGCNALPEVWADEALRAAEAADRALAQGRAARRLEGVTVTVKVNQDVAGHATTDGVAGGAAPVATDDAPAVAALRAAGAVLVGRSNAPAFSLRWFTDNALHGRTLNPFDPGRTPGGSSGGAAVAVALGMGAVGLANDSGGSIRYPAWVNGVAGLRPTVGRVPSYRSTAPQRGLAAQLTTSHGPICRSVDDLRLLLPVLAQGSPLDPTWVDAPLAVDDLPERPRVALLRRHPGYDADRTVLAQLDRAAGWLRAAGCAVEELLPPHFEEAAALWQGLSFNEARRAGVAAVERSGDAAARATLRHALAGTPEWDRDTLLHALMRRNEIARDWQLLLERHTALLLPVSWQAPFPVDADQRGAAAMEALTRAQSPLLATAVLGLPGLSVPTGMADGLPGGVQLVAARFREDRLLHLGAMIERAARGKI